MLISDSQRDLLSIQAVSVKKYPAINFVTKGGQFSQLGSLSDKLLRHAIPIESCDCAMLLFRHVESTKPGPAFG